MFHWRWPANQITIYQIKGRVAVFRCKFLKIIYVQQPCPTRSSLRASLSWVWDVFTSMAGACLLVKLVVQALPYVYYVEEEMVVNDRKHEKREKCGLSIP